MKPRQTCRRVIRALLSCMAFSLVVGEIRADDREQLTSIATSIRANIERIKTWRGTAVCSRTFKMKSPPDGIPAEQSSKISFSFLVDFTNGHYLSRGTLLESDSKYVDGESVDLLFPNPSYMHKDGLFYSYSDYPNDRDGKVPVDNSAAAFEDLPGAGVVKFAVVSVDKPNKLETRSEFFHPLYRMSYEGEDLAELFALYAMAMERRKISKLSDSGEATLQAVGEVVTLSISTNSEDTSVSREYSVDLGKGGLCTAFRYKATKGGLVTDIADWKCEPESVNGAWVPRQTSYQRDNSGVGHFITDAVQWTEHRINDPVVADDFTLVSLGMHRGDELHDKRTGDVVRITGDEFPAREPGPSLARQGSSTFRTTVMWISLFWMVFLVGYVTWKRFGRRSSQKAKTQDTSHSG